MTQNESDSKRFKKEVSSPAYSGGRYVMGFVSSPGMAGKPSSGERASRNAGNRNIKQRPSFQRPSFPTGGFPEVSVVIQVCDGAETIGGMIGGVMSAMKNCGKKFEIIIVDDGSSDISVNIIEAVAGKYEMVVPITHAARLGHTQTVENGIASAKGRVIITMSASGEDNPHVIPEMLEKADGGAAVVTARGLPFTFKDKLLEILVSPYFSLMSRRSGVKLRAFSFNLYAANFIYSLGVVLI